MFCQCFSIVCSTVKQLINELFNTDLFSMISQQSCPTGLSIECKPSVRNPGFRVNSFRMTNTFEVKVHQENFLQRISSYNLQGKQGSDRDKKFQTLHVGFYTAAVEFDVYYKYHFEVVVITCNLTSMLKIMSKTVRSGISFTYYDFRHLQWWIHYLHTLGYFLKVCSSSFLYF